MNEPDGDAAQWETEGPSGSTPLESDELEGLIPSWVATRSDLNEAEQQNILHALDQRRWRRATTEHLLDDLAARELHKDMFGQVWKWAGRYRLTERNIGVEPRMVAVCVRDLMEDAKSWIESGTTTSDEAACRFHHRLVQVHPFPNGNGRHARAMTDLLLRSLGAPAFTWGRAGPDGAGAVRAAYIAALRAADSGDFEALATFLHS
ncbi:MAG: mobile mystery protein B [Actinomycetota bacterium]|nr:mobile mystery protein B [Actinomycetota bacterium]